MDIFIEIITKWLPIVTSVIGSFALIATMTKNKWDNRVCQLLANVVNFLAANFGKSKNSDTV